MDDNRLYQSLFDRCRSAQSSNNGSESEIDVPRPLSTSHDDATRQESQGTKDPVPSVTTSDAKPLYQSIYDRIKGDSMENADGHSDDSEDLIPDTPSPVFAKLPRHRQHNQHAKTSASADTEETLTMSHKEKSGDPTRDHHSDKKTRQQRALNQLRKRRLRLFHKTKDESHDSDQHFSSDTAKKTAETILSNSAPSDDSDDDLVTLPFMLRGDSSNHGNSQQNGASSGAGTSRINPNECGDSAAAANMTWGSAINICDSTDSSDISEDDLEDYIRGLCVTNSKNGMNSGRYSSGQSQTRKETKRKKSRSPPNPDISSSKRGRFDSRMDTSPPSTSRDLVSLIMQDSDDDDDNVHIIESGATTVSSTSPGCVPSLDTLGMGRSNTKLSRPVTNQTSHRDLFTVPTHDTDNDSDVHVIESGAMTVSSDSPGHVLLLNTPFRSNTRLSPPIIPTPQPLASSSTPIQVCPFQRGATGSTHRDGKTSTQTRVPGLRRRGNRSRLLSGGTPSNLLISPQTRAENQLAEDEAMARRLQEELDREYAATLEPPTMLGEFGTTGHVTSPTRAVHRHGHRAAEASRTGGRSSMVRRLGDEAAHDHYLHAMLAGMSEGPEPQQGSMDSAVRFSGTSSSVADNRAGTDWVIPRQSTTTRRGRNSSRLPSSSGGSRSNSARALTDALDYEADMYFRIGQMSEQDWSLHQAIFHNRNQDLNDSVQGALDGILDPAILQFMSRRGSPPANGRVRHQPDTAWRTSPPATNNRRRPRGRPRRVNRDFSTSFTANDYEALLDLGERIGDVKPRGLTANQINMLPTKPYREVDVPANGTKECNICFGEYTEGNTLRLLQCFHYFHDNCIDRWLTENPSCPICRVEVKLD